VVGVPEPYEDFDPISMEGFVDPDLDLRDLEAMASMDFMDDLTSAMRNRAHGVMDDAEGFAHLREFFREADEFELPADFLREMNEGEVLDDNSIANLLRDARNGDGYLLYNVEKFKLLEFFRDSDVHAKQLSYLLGRDEIKEMGMLGLTKVVKFLYEGKSNEEIFAFCLFPELDISEFTNLSVLVWLKEHEANIRASEEYNDTGFKDFYDFLDTHDSPAVRTRLLAAMVKFGNLVAQTDVEKFVPGYFVFFTGLSSGLSFIDSILEASVEQIVSTSELIKNARSLGNKYFVEFNVASFFLVNKYIHEHPWILEGDHENMLEPHSYEGTTYFLRAAYDPHYLQGQSPLHFYSRENFPETMAMLDRFGISVDDFLRSNPNLDKIHRKFSSLDKLAANYRLQVLVKKYFTLDLDGLISICNNYADIFSRPDIETLISSLHFARQGKGQKLKLDDLNVIKSFEYPAEFLDWILRLYSNSSVRFDFLGYLPVRSTANCLSELNRWYRDQAQFEKACEYGIFLEESGEPRYSDNPLQFTYAAVSALFGREEAFIKFLAKNNQFANYLKDSTGRYGGRASIFEWFKDPGLLSAIKASGEFDDMSKLFLCYDAVKNAFAHGPEFLKFILNNNLLRFINSKERVKGVFAWYQEPEIYKKAHGAGFFEEFKNALGEEKWPDLLREVSGSDLLGLLSQIQKMPHLKKHFANLIKFPKEKWGYFLKIVQKIDDSPVQEIQRLKRQLTPLILDSENPTKAYEQIENLFIKNNLPLATKLFQIFKILFPGERLESVLRDSHLSPYLRRLNRRTGVIYSSIYADLLRIHILSGNRSLRDFVDVLIDGEELLERYEADEDSLNESEAEELDYFLQKLDATASFMPRRFYGTEGQAGENESGGSDLRARVDSLRDNLAVRSGSTIGDSIAKRYLRPLGLETLQGLKEMMQTEKTAAHERGVDLSRQIQEGNIPLEEGDLFKGVDHNFLDRFCKMVLFLRNF
jgi:hypothetical protein